MTRTLSALGSVSASRSVRSGRFYCIKKSCTKRELDSLIGQLQHTCAVVKAGRSFLRRIIELSKIAHKPWQLNRSFHSDLMWWRLFLHSWNGIFYDVHTYAHISRPIHYIRRLWNMGLCSSMGYSLVPATVGDRPLCKLSDCLKGVTEGLKGRHVLCYCDSESQELVRTRISCTCSAVYFSLRQA